LLLLVGCSTPTPTASDLSITNDLSIANDLSTVSDLAAAPPDLLNTADLASADLTSVFRLPAPLVQKGTVTTGNATLTATLPSPSRAGTMLVFTLTFDAGADPAIPSGWLRWSGYSSANDAEIFYRPNNPGGVTSQSITLSSATASVGQLSEWSFTNSDAGAWYWDSGAVTSPGNRSPVTTTQVGPDFALGCFSVLTTTDQMVTIAPASGWGLFDDNRGSSSKLHYAVHFALSLPAGTTVQEAATSSAAGTWGGTIVTWY
jgi:hypothetical protein